MLLLLPGRKSSCKSPAVGEAGVGCHDCVVVCAAAAIALGCFAPLMLTLRACFRLLLHYLADEGGLRCPSRMVYLVAVFINAGRRCCQVPMVGGGRKMRWRHADGPATARIDTYLIDRYTSRTGNARRAFQLD